MTDAEQQFAGEGQEISLNDIVDFFVNKWKVLLVVALSGFVMALGGALLFLDKYEAKASILVKPVIADYSGWAGLRRELPVLAAQMAEHEKNNDSFLGGLSSEEWWRTSVAPTYAITREEAKNVFGMPKTIEGGAALNIENLVATVRAQGEEEALTKLSRIAAFIRSGISYLTLKKLVSDYEVSFHRAEPQIKLDIMSANERLGVLDRLMASLQLLKKQFPEDAVNLPVDLKGPDVKYLPLSTQIIALTQDIQAGKENLMKLNDKLAQLEMTANFLTQARQALDKNFDGIAVMAELARIESSLRKGTAHTDLNSLAVLNDIRNRIAIMQTNFTFEFGKQVLVKTARLLHLKFAAVGLAAGFFLALLLALGSVVWSRYREQKLHG